MLDIVGTIQATTLVEPSQISLGESADRPKTVTVTLKKSGAAVATYALGHVPALASAPNTMTGASYAPSAILNGPAAASFSVRSIVVPAGGSASFDVTLTTNAGLPGRSLYSGYVTLTPQGGGAVYRVPYAGMKGDCQRTVVLTPTANGFPWLGQVVGTNLVNRASGGTYSMQGSDIPYFPLHLDHCRGACGSRPTTRRAASPGTGSATTST